MNSAGVLRILFGLILIVQIAQGAQSVTSPSTTREILRICACSDAMHIPRQSTIVEVHADRTQEQLRADFKDHCDKYCEAKETEFCDQRYSEVMASHNELGRSSHHYTGTCEEMKSAVNVWKTQWEKLDVLVSEYADLCLDPEDRTAWVRRASNEQGVRRVEENVRGFCPTDAALTAGQGLNESSQALETNAARASDGFEANATTQASRAASSPADPLESLEESYKRTCSSPTSQDARDVCKEVRNELIAAGKLVADEQSQTGESPISIEQLRTVTDCIRRIDRKQCYSGNDHYECRMKRIVPAERTCRAQAGIRSPYTSYESYAEKTMTSPPPELVAILESCFAATTTMCDARVGDCGQRQAEATRECRIYVNFEKAAPPPPGLGYGEGNDSVQGASMPMISRPNQGVDRSR